MKVKMTHVSQENMTKAAKVGSVLKKVAIGAVVGAAAISTIFLASELLKPSANDLHMLFNGADQASIAKYYNIKTENGTYFVNAEQITSVLPDKCGRCMIGLAVDKDGNATVIAPQDVNKNSDVVDRVDIAKKDGDNVYMDGVDVTVEVGYSITYKGKKYDISKNDLVTNANKVATSYTPKDYTYNIDLNKVKVKASTNGGADRIIKR